MEFNPLILISRCLGITIAVFIYESGGRKSHAFILLLWYGFGHGQHRARFFVQWPVLRLKKPNFDPMLRSHVGFSSSLIFDPGPTLYIARGVRRLKCAQAYFSKPRLTPATSSLNL